MNKDKAQKRSNQIQKEHDERELASLAPIMKEAIKERTLREFNQTIKYQSEQGNYEFANKVINLRDNFDMDKIIEHCYPWIATSIIDAVADLYLEHIED